MYKKKTQDKTPNGRKHQIVTYSSGAERDQHWASAIHQLPYFRTGCWDVRVVCVCHHGHSQIIKKKKRRQRQSDEWQCCLIRHALRSHMPAQYRHTISYLSLRVCICCVFFGKRKWNQEMCRYVKRKVNLSTSSVSLCASQTQKERPRRLSSTKMWW